MNMESVQAVRSKSPQFEANSTLAYVQTAPHRPPSPSDPPRNLRNHIFSFSQQFFILTVNTHDSTGGIVVNMQGSSANQIFCAGTRNLQRKKHFRDIYRILQNYN